MLSDPRLPPVGIDPTGAEQLERLLEEEARTLVTLAARVQATLDEAGIACTVPQEIRGAAGWCGGTAADLGQRIGAIRGTSRRVAGALMWSMRRQRPGGQGLPRPLDDDDPLGRDCAIAVGPIPVLSCRPGVGEPPPVLGGSGGGESRGGIGSLRPTPGLGGRTGPSVTPPASPRGPIYDKAARSEPEAEAEPEPRTEPEPEPVLIYEPSPKHDQKRPGVGPQPTNPEEVLDDSVEVKPRQRIGYDREAGEIVVFRETYNGQGHYHGYVLAYDDLNQEQRNVLHEQGLVNLRGKPIG